MDSLRLTPIQPLYLADRTIPLGPNISAEELDSHGLSDDPSDAALHKVSIDQFKDNLSERDRQILEYRMQGRTLEEIAQLVGYQNAGAVYKRIEKIIEEYKQFEDR